MKTFLIVMFVLHVIVALALFFLGLLGTVEYADSGTKDRDYQRGRLLLKWFWLPEIAFVKLIQFAQREAEEYDQR